MSTGTAHLFPGKQFISTVLAALETKSQWTGSMARRYIMRSAMAGIIIALVYVTMYGVLAVFAALAGDGWSLAPLGRIAGAATFGWALVFIYFSKSELLTSNMMIVSIGMYYRHTNLGRVTRILGLCFLGNALGALLVAVLLRGSTVLDGPVLAQMLASVDHKLEYISHGPSGWLDLFVRAILCNFLINLAMLLIYAGIFKEDLIKAVVMLVAVFAFVFLGFEHSVANTALFIMVGLKDGIDIGLAAGNVLIALLGNFVGGGVLIGLYYAYLNDDTKYVRATTTNLQ